jgi:hypothetical protein
MPKQAMYPTHAATDPALAQLSFTELPTDAKYTERLEATMREIQSSEYGQARRDIKRLEANYGKSSTRIKIDGEYAITTGVRPSTGIVAIVPSDVATDAIKSGLEGEQIGFSVQKMNVTQKELIELADHIAWFAASPR